MDRQRREPAQPASQPAGDRVSLPASHWRWIKRTYVFGDATALFAVNEEGCVVRKPLCIAGSVPVGLETQSTYIDAVFMERLSRVEAVRNDHVAR